MDFEKLKEMLKSIEGGEEAIKFLEERDSTLRSGEEKQRKAKGELLKLLGVEDKDSAIAKINSLFGELESTKNSTKEFTELLTKMGVSNADEIVKRIDSIEVTLGTVTEEREAEKAERLKAEKEKEQTLLENSVIKAIADMDIDDKSGTIKDAMLYRAKKDETSGDYLIGESSFKDFLQKQIDNKETTFKTKTKEDRLPDNGKTKLAEENEARLAMGLPLKEN